MGIDAESVRAWSWWSSPQWKAYTEAYGSAAGRPVHGQSYVVDLSEAPAFSKGHHCAVKAQAATQRFLTISNTEAMHLAHSTASGRETRSQSTWDLMDQWISEDHGLCLTNSKGGWSYLIVDAPGAYYASSVGKDCHFLLSTAMENLREAGFQWFELGEAHTPGIGTFKAGFGGVLID